MAKLLLLFDEINGDDDDNAHGAGERTLEQVGSNYRKCISTVGTQSVYIK